MSIGKIYKSRRQTKQYDKLRAPSNNDIQWLLQATAKIVPSKQNLMPYTIHVLGPKNKEYKKIFWELTQNKYNHQQDLFAPYLLIFTSRLAKDNEYTKSKPFGRHDATDEIDFIKKGQQIESSIEIGMYAMILTGLAIEKGLGVSYFRCFPSWEENNKDMWRDLPFIKTPVLFSLQIGYAVDGFNPYNSGETRPEPNEIIDWIEVPSADSSGEQTS
jgi:hypothetical protein